MILFSFVTLVWVVTPSNTTIGPSPPIPPTFTTLSIREFVGLMTVTDFISILRRYSQTSIPISDLASKSIADIITAPPEMGKLKHDIFDAADVSATLGQCCRLMHAKGVDFLPVILPSDGEKKFGGCSIIFITLTTLQRTCTHTRSPRACVHQLYHDPRIPRDTLS